MMDKKLRARFLAAYIDTVVHGMFEEGIKTAHDVMPDGYYMDRKIRHRFTEDEYAAILDGMAGDWISLNELDYQLDELYKVTNEAFGLED